MADFIRGAANFAFGVSRSSSTATTKERDNREKEKLQASPSLTGSDDLNNVDLNALCEDFDPFTNSQADNDDNIDAANINVALVAPPEKE
jgi:hypothetical protein